MGKAGLGDLPQDMIDALVFMLGYIDHDQWDDALIAEEESGVRRAILKLKGRFGL